MKVLYFGGVFGSLILILAGLVIWFYPDILERILAIVLIVLGVSGLLSKRWFR